MLKKNSNLNLENFLDDSVYISLFEQQNYWRKNEHIQLHIYFECWYANEYYSQNNN